ncbi:uncharacterized protein BDR25DRAFT_938 [Lindgomyces ingoldianus]|uniref:Uncharacterized protein n=1 Tax=Lindgomyces ingoldianus TaxID=673940 RepID=A0ACB6RFE6_9PLEO|nr:uncharacterized protein BDR25DRAFT_938 [Lindgomyces ingoldianus]KAF2477445.1 hypothetical protein BDR25DRAFT_938 [Lindgomyces ingoldianus]
MKSEQQQRDSIAQTQCKMLPNPVENENSGLSHTGSSTSDNGDVDNEYSMVSRMMLDTRQVLVENAMRKFIRWYMEAGGFKHHPKGPNTEGTSGNMENRLSLTPRNSRKAGKRKAPDDGSDNTDNEETPTKRRRRNGQGKPCQTGHDLRLACPFFKKDPTAHMRGSCSGPGWDTVHRVKEHIYRAHTLPLVCPRCKIDVQDHRGLTEHLKSVDQCELKDSPSPSFRWSQSSDGISQDQIEGLRKLSQRGQSQRDKWRGVYKFIFAVEDESHIPSPFYDFGSTFTSSEEVYRNQFVTIMEKELKRVVEEEIRAVSERLNSRIPELLRNTQRILHGQDPNTDTSPVLISSPTQHLLSPAQSNHAHNHALPNSIHTTCLHQDGTMESPRFSRNISQPREPSSSNEEKDSGYVSPGSLNEASSHYSEPDPFNELGNEGMSADSNNENPELNQAGVGFNNAFEERHLHHTPTSFAQGDPDLDMTNFIDWTQGLSNGFLDLPENQDWFS